MGKPIRELEIGTIYGRWTVKEIEKCDVICRNCHGELHWAEDWF